MMKPQSYIRKDDKVKIITGKDKGKIGKIIKVFQDKNRVMVEKVNMVKRHSRPTAQNKQGGIVETEAPIHWSNVQLMCNKCMAQVRVEMRRLEDGKKVRACKKCNEIIDE